MKPTTVHIEQMKQHMDAVYKEFKKNPSAANFITLERAMRFYQDAIKNHND